MRRAILNKYIDVIGQADLIHTVRESPGRHVLFLGAGVSKEAKVPLANEICEDIKNRLLNGRDLDDANAWARENLAWDDITRRYMTCLSAYGSAAQRVTYFRQLLKDRRPAFAHHAIALLMTRGVVFETALTTNFDKLLERAFLEQGVRECQAIRTADEGEYWVEENDKCYVFKLHGDYDTRNILNTQPETRSVLSTFFVSHAVTTLRGRGLVVLGSAANEESIVEVIKRLALSEDRPVLAGGIRWGVFVGSRRPENLSTADELDHLQTAIERGAVNRQLVELLGDVHDKFGDRRPCSFFPVWGTGNLLLSLINSTGNAQLSQAAQLLLDHNMRLHATFRRQRLDPDVIETHINNLEQAQLKVGRDSEVPDRPVRTAFDIRSRESPTTIHIGYGDVTSISTMGEARWSGHRRAVVSPEDTTVSAGGGVALRLLTKAGPRQLLNELSKLSPIEHGTSVATSAGELPVHYILHAAALRLRQDGSYDISAASIESAIKDALRIADALAVSVVWIPLLGTGVGGVEPEDSLTALLRAASGSDTRLAGRAIHIVIYQEDTLGRNETRTVLQATLPEGFTFTEK